MTSCEMDEREKYKKNVYYHLVYVRYWQIEIDTGCFDTMEIAKDYFNNRMNAKLLVGFFKVTVNEVLEYEFIKELI